MYQLSINQGNLVTLINQVSKQVINQEKSPQNVFHKSISCELMISSNYPNELLTCFTADDKTYSIVSSIFDPEHDLSFLYFSKNLVETKGTLIIRSSLSPNKINSFICLVDDNTYLSCLLYNSIKNELSNLIQFVFGAQLYSYNMDVNYIDEKKEY